MRRPNGLILGFGLLGLLGATACQLALPPVYKGLVPATRGDGFLAQPQEGFVRIGDVTWPIEDTSYRKLETSDGKVLGTAIVEFDERQRSIVVILDGRRWSETVLAKLTPNAERTDARGRNVTVRPVATGGAGIDGDLVREDGSVEPFALFVHPGAGRTKFRVHGNTAELRGNIGHRFDAQLQALLDAYPNIDTLKLVEVPGGRLSPAAIAGARRIRAEGLTTIVPRNGWIASAGVLYFAAGQRRIVERGGRVGVHAWRQFAFDGLGEEEIPTDPELEHDVIEFFRDMLGSRGESFYRFTLEAAPFEDIHWMSRGELRRFRVVTN